MDQMQSALKKAGIRSQPAQAVDGNSKTNPGKNRNQFNNPPPIKFKENGRLRWELLTKDAKEWAESLKGVTDTQLRNFYNQVKAIQARIEATGDFDQNAPLIALLKPKIAYYVKKSKSKDEEEPEEEDFL